MKKIGLLPRLFAAMAIGIVIGWLAPAGAIRLTNCFRDTFGQFISFIVPLIILGLVTPAIIDTGKAAGRMLLMTIAIAWVSTVVFGWFAYGVSATVFPKVISGTLDATAVVKTFPAYFALKIPPILDVITALILSLVIGFGSIAIDAEVCTKAANELRRIVTLTLEHAFVPFLPLYILTVMADLTASGKLAAVGGSCIVIMAVAMATTTSVLVIQFLVAGLIVGKNPLKCLVNMLPAYLTGWGCCSSAATIPYTLACTKKNGVSDETASLVIPLCSSMHMAGSMANVVVYSAGLLVLLGHGLPVAAYAEYILLVSFVAVASPGVPGGVVLATSAIAQSALGMTPEQYAIMIALYLALDGMGTACNLTGDGAIALIVDRIRTRTSKRGIAVSALLSATLFLLPSAATAGEMVPDPYRAADVKWPKYVCKGRDWRLLLTPDAQTLDCMKDEPFAKDAGYHMIYCAGTWPEFRGDYAFAFMDEEPKYLFIPKHPQVMPDVYKRMKEVPFQIYEWSRGVYDIPREKCDLSVYEQLEKDCPETFLGVVHGEWDAGILYFLPRKSSDRYIEFAKHYKMPCPREEMAQHFVDFLRMSANLKGDRFLPHSGPCNLNHLAGEAGATCAHMELTHEQSWRMQMLHTRSCGRQFGIPLGYYIAFFLGQHTADARPNVNPAWGENWGIPPSLMHRAIMLAYYQGCNYQDFECFPWAFAKPVEVDDSRSAGKKKKTTILTDSGKYLKEAYDFIRSPNGARGEYYAPILLLADRAHGHDGLNRRISIKDGWGPFANQYPPTIFDQFYQDLADIISPPMPSYDELHHYNATNGYQCCLVNSALNDIFDLFIANPKAKGKELRADQLAKYPIVMSLGGILWTDDLKAMIRDYVAKGGTFVNVEGEEPAIRHRLGYGNVLTAPRDPEKLRNFLKLLQRFVVPLEVSTDCELVWNVMPDGSWRVCAVNNKGVEKPPATTVTKFHDECFSWLRFFPPKGSKLEVRELYANQKAAAGLIWKIPPGAVRVFEIKGLPPRHAQPFDLTKIDDPNVPPFEFPLKFKHVDMGNYDTVEIQADYDTDEVTVECYAKPLPEEEWKAQKHPTMDGGPFMVGMGWNQASKNFGPTWKKGHWWLKRNVDTCAEWLKGPKADPTRFTKLAATLKDGTLHLFVDDKEVFGENGPILHPERTPKCTFYNLFTFWRYTSSFRVGNLSARFLGEVKDCHAYSKAIYPLKYEVEKPSGGDDTAAIQKTIDAAVEKTGEVVLKAGTYKVSRLQMKTGVTLHLEEGAVIEKVGGESRWTMDVDSGCKKVGGESRGTMEGSVLVAANGVSDFTILGKGAVKGDILIENCQRVTVRRLGGGKLVLKGSKNVVVEDSKNATIENQNSTRILVDGKLLP